MSVNKVNKELIEQIRTILQDAHQQAATAVKSAMIYAYWEIGHRIVEEEQKGSERAKYSTYLLKELAAQLNSEFGKSFDARELRRFRQFYLCFPIRGTVCPKLSWSHYRLLIRVENVSARNFYITESIDHHWNVRKLGRNIGSQYYNRIRSSKAGSKNLAKSRTPSKLDFIKDPYVLEFLDLPANLAHKEKDIEDGINASVN